MSHGRAGIRSNKGLLETIYIGVLEIAYDAVKLQHKCHTSMNHAPIGLGLDRQPVTMVFVSNKCQLHLAFIGARISGQILAQMPTVRVNWICGIVVRALLPVSPLTIGTTFFSISSSLILEDLIACSELYKPCHTALAFAEFSNAG